MKKNVYLLEAKKAKSEVSGNFIHTTVDSRQCKILVYNIESSSTPVYKQGTTKLCSGHAKSDTYFCFIP